MTRPVDHDSRSPRRKTTTRRQPLPPVVEAPAHVLAAPRWMLEVSTPSRPIDPTAVPTQLRFGIIRES
jgi:hypothetical protein